MLRRWLSSLEPVHRATTREQREEIYRFRYGIYVDELKRGIGGVDHARKTVSDEGDEAPWATHFYAKSGDKILGAVRISCWEPGQVPPDEADALSLDLFPNRNELRVSEIGRFMISPTMRGKLVLSSLAYVTYDFLAGEKKADLSFCYCRPGLVGYYRRLGARPYGGRLVEAPEGMEVPLVSVLSDEATYKAAGAPMASQVKQHFGKGKRVPVDTRPFAHLFTDGHRGVDVDPVSIWADLQQHLFDPDDGVTTFFEALGPEITRRITATGVVLQTAAGTMVTRQGHAERELYVVLEGQYEARVADRVVARFGKGEVFGEIGFFRQTGERSASVFATKDSRVVVLRRKFLDDLGKSDPEAAQSVLFALGRVLAERLAQTNAQIC